MNVYCRKIENATHADICRTRLPESKSRIITIEQMRDLMQEIHLKPTEAAHKVAVIIGADRLNVQAANAFLKNARRTAGEFRTDFAIHRAVADSGNDFASRCLRLNFFGDGKRELDSATGEWLGKFGALAASEQKSLLGRYRLLDVLLQKLGEIRTGVDEMLTARSPLEKYDDVEKGLRDKWEDELTAAIEAEYRRKRADLLLLVQFWLRDIWLHTVTAGNELLNFPKISGAETVARRINSKQALENLQTIEQTQRLLHTNVQGARAGSQLAKIAFLK